MEVNQPTMDTQIFQYFHIFLVTFSPRSVREENRIGLLA